MKNITSKKRQIIKETVGLTVKITVASVTVHHFLRKQKYPEARLLDYFEGLSQQVGRIYHANTNAYIAWCRIYKNSLKDQSFSQYDQIFKPSKSFTQVEWVSGVANIGKGEGSKFSVVGIDINRQIIWQTALPERVHDIVVQPKSNYQTRNIAVIGRRPSEFFWILDVNSGDIIRTVKSNKNRHYYGHACYSLDGNLLYVTENNTEDFSGLVGIYSVSDDYKKVDEFFTYGIGPHEIAIHPDGDKLIVANGGIKTEKASREELNLDSMQPSLAYISLAKDDLGKLIQHVKPKHKQMSIRHLSVAQYGKFKDVVGIGIQFQGDKFLDIPLLLLHKFGEDNFSECIVDTSWKKFHQYIASVVINPKYNLLCATSPIGGCVSIFDISSLSLIGTVKLTDCAGVIDTEDGFLVSDGKGSLTLLRLSNNILYVDRLKKDMAFDNHMKRVVK